MKELTKERFVEKFREILESEYFVEPQEASAWQIQSAVGKIIMARITPDANASLHAHTKTRRACYFSMEFLVGRAIYNNLLSLGLLDVVDEALKECGISVSVFEDIEDAALGNGGLGRLAACFLDSAATLDLPIDGYGIRYRYGLFKQEIVDGFQKETADDWSEHGDPWSKRTAGDSVLVHFADQTVNAVPYDMPVLGYHTNHISNLRLWQSEAVHPFDFNLFNDQKYDEAVRDKNRAEDISRVLYPNDSSWEGKKLRLKQEYFFTCASLTSILRDFKRVHGKDWSRLSDYVTIQLNDTHPVLAIPELMRQLVDEENINFDEALAICKRIFNYTNHTIMAEALESWPVDLVRSVIPNVYAMIELLNNALIKEVSSLGMEQEQYRLQIINDGTVYMARMAIFMSRVVNGVARLHTEILKRNALNEWYRLYPDRFQNKTNGVTQRRWLALCNRELTGLLKEKLGSDAFITNLQALRKLLPLAEDEDTIRQFMAVKQQKKEQLAAFIREHDGAVIDPNTIFDIQIKRLHEYKRQLMNAFSILYIYYGIKDGSITGFAPTTFLFAAKSAPGYFRAKGIIKYINEIAELVNNDPDTKGILNVVFVKNYNVSSAEKLVAAADTSIQISTAGFEASGTGNMKLMLNGAVTLGTLDGANVEIVEEAGIENNYIFGAKVEELNEIMPHYNAHALYESDPKIKRVVDTLIDGTFSDGGQHYFRELYNSLVQGAVWSTADTYYVLGDLTSFVEARLRLNRDAQNKEEFARKCFRNICCSGKFSSDRTIRHYAEMIWEIEPVEVNW